MVELRASSRHSNWKAQETRSLLGIVGALLFALSTSSCDVTGNEVKSTKVCSAKFIGDTVNICKPAKTIVDGPGTLEAQLCTKFTINSATSDNIVVPVPSLLSFLLNVEGISGGFYSDSACTTPVSGISLSQGDDSVDFYFYGNAPGNGTITITGGGLDPGSFTFTTTPVAPPQNPTITSPAGSFASNADPGLAITGTCVSGDTVQLTGSDQQNVACGSDGTFAFNVAETNSGTFNYQINQINPKRGGPSSNLGVTWVHDTRVPSVVQLTSPASSPFTSSGTQLSIFGNCTTGDLITLSGGSAQTFTCAGSAFNFTVSQSQIGQYTYNLVATNPANGLSSNTLSLDWNKVSPIPPSAPVISSPSTSPYYSNTSSVTISGSCVSGNTVTLSGSSSQSMPCANSQFSFAVPKSADGTYPFSVTQTGSDNGLVSSAATASWVRDTVAPVVTTITSPSHTPFTSGGSALTISGTCQAGSTVAISGAMSSSVPCSNGTYTFVANKSSDGTYNYTITLTDLAGNVSASTAVQWIRDTSAPSAPTITSPSSSPYYSNGNSVTVAGTCVTGDTVNLSGASSQSMVCANSQFSFTVSKSSDGTYAYSVAQTDQNNGNVSAAASVSWIRDTIAPVQITVTSPASNPYASSGNSIVLSGPCVIGDTVTVSGAFSASSLCTSGSYSFTSTKSSDGAYIYTIVQTDPAGNSSPAATLAWTRDTTTPGAPVITSPSSSPYYSNGSSVTVAGSCVTGDTVTLSGASSQSMVCANSQFSFTVSKSSDGTYAYSVAQTDPNNGNVSSAASLSWIRDTVAPVQIAVTSPASNPYASSGNSITLSGPCVIGDTVTVSGAFSASSLCTSGSYSFTSTKSSDGAYVYTVVQTDPAGNSSPAATLTWTRDTTTPNAPVITSPSSSPYYSNGSSVTISGSCVTGDTVNLSGASSQSMVCANSQFSFTGSKSSDGTYAYSVAQTDPNNGNISAAASLSWVRDTVAPVQITVTSPTSNPYASSGNSITLSGPCIIGDTVTVSGAFSASALCTSGSYSFTSTKSSDGSYIYTIVQTDPAGNSSPAATLAWTRDTTTPGAPVITSPGSSPYYSNGSSVTVAGSCVTGDTVNLSGASSQSMVCTNSQFSFTVNKSTDGTYAYSVAQTDPNNGNTSSAVSGSWIRDTVAPAQITFTSPATNPFASGGNSVTLSGPCVIGDTVTVSGAFSASALCSSGSYSFTSTKSSDGAYNYTIVQTDPAGNSSPAATLAWTRDTTTPGAPVITSPTSPYYSNGSSVTVAGSCVTGDTVNLSGASSQSMVCANSQFSFTVNKSTDGTYAYSVAQTDPNNGDVSSASSGSWIRDTVAPAQITFVSPATNPYASGGNSITLSGPCEVGDTVVVSGAFSASALCTSGSYSFTSTKSSDGSYSYSVIQTDLAGNSSTAATFAWTRDTTTPGAPVITSPSSSPYYTNGSSLTVAGSCVTGDTVKISGESSQSMVCANSQFSFTVNKSADGNYSFSVVQCDPNNGNSSSAASFTWVRDTVAPAKITFVTPASNPFASGGSAITLSGPCEVGDTVAVSGAFSASVLCSSGSYSFTSSKSSDGAYSYSVVQTDLAGNSSTPATFAWTRDTTTPSAPVISSPSSSPYYSNGSSVTLAGSCVTGDTVNLSGASSQSMVCANSQFSFTVSKSTDGTYAYSVAQTDPNNGNASSAASGSWIRDTVAPAQITFTSPASNPYASGGNSITFSGPCVIGDTVTVSGAFSASALCSSGSYSFTSAKSSDGSYSYSVIQTDLAGNSSTAATFAWTRDTTTPSAPVISSPGSSPYYSNGSSVTIAGSCVTGDTVNLSGASSQSMVCASSQFTFTLSKSTDGTYAYSVAQTDPNNGNPSSAASWSWIRDTVIPPVISFTSPASNPFASGGNSMTFSGPCIVGDTVTVSGAFSASALCSSGSYSFTSTKSTDGAYSYTVVQTDPAGNSSPAATLAWTRDTTTPSAPVITSPSSSPYYSNGSSVTVAGSCVTGDTVNLSGASSQSMVCANSQFSFTLSKSSDGTYAYSVAQTDPNNGNASSAASGSWIRDTVVPAQITFTSPATNPFASGGNSITLSGPCVIGDTVAVSGGFSASTLCTSGSYSFTSTKSTDGAYSYTVIQTDPAGNSSPSATLAWTRDTTTPSAPVIASPSSSPYYSNGSSVTVAGSCVTGDTVNLSGASSQSMVCANSQFSFTLSKSSDGTYAYSVAQTDPNNGNASSAASGSWIRDTVVPAQITFTSPAINPFASGGNSITLSGPCVIGDTVTVSGAFTASALCTSGSYSFTSTKSTDGSYSYTVVQTDPAGNSSPAATLAWTRDTTTPGAPVISSPSSSPYYSNGSSVTVSGSCVTGDTVNLSGASSQSMVCANSQFSFSISKSTDGTYTYSVAQTDPNNGDVSSAASGSWIRDTVVPAQITFTSPATNPYASGGNSITLSGPCVIGDTVTVSGAFSASALCSSGSYSFTSTKSSDGSYSYSVIQTDLAGNSSTPATFAWTRDTTTPSAPVISSPSTSPYYSNGNSVTVAGSCMTGDTVNLSGASSQSMACANSQFSFSFSKSTDGTYAFSVAQTDPNNGNASSAASGSWIRDTVIPAVISFTSPASNPYASGGNSITFSGSCIIGDTVTVSGAFSASALCTSGSYSFTSSKSSDGSYIYTVVQTDPAGNSSPAATLAWTRDTTTPSAPVISSPSSSPYYSNGNSVTVAGSCVTGDTVNLSGASSQSMVCANSQFSFSVSKSTDGTYAFSVAQTDPNNGNASSATSGSWIRDTVIPAQITFTSPASNPYASGGNSITLSGPCVTGDTVTVSGAFSGSALCVAGSYSFTSTKSSDGSYSYSVIQTDLAGNSSTAATFAWTRDTTTPSAPVISSPSSSPYYSNGNSVTVAGSCVTGDTVNLSGASSQSMVCANSQFSFSISKSTDGTYAFSVAQTDPNNSNASSAASGSWIRDTVAPAQITFTSPASNPYASGGSSITLSGPCEVGDTVVVSGAFSASALCSSGSYSFTSAKSSDGSYSYSVIQTDLAGNSSTAATFAWTRDTTTPGAPVISSPSSSPYYSNGNSVTVAGSCITGDTVALTGASSQSMVCANSQFSFTVSKSTDGTYAYSVVQTDPNNGNASSASSGSWIRDTVIPTQITFTSPASNPYASGGNSITLSGPCVIGDTVTVSGAFTASALCTAGSYSFTSTKSTDGSYSYTVVQTDPAGNSSPAATLAWTRDTTTPGAPVISSPSLSPYYSNGSSVTVAGSCVTGDTVNLSGASSQSMVCTNSQFSFSISKSTDGTYTYSVAQTDPNNGDVSSAASGSWIRDTVIPAQITFTSPASNPYASGGNSITLSGPCVVGDTVTVSGAFSASALCSSGSYSFTSTKSSDGSYSYSVIQTDLAGNSSTAATFAWTRDTTTPSAPVISSPSTSPYYSNGNSVTVAGSCVTGDTVNLSGASSQSMVCASAQFSFTLSKSTDGTYAYSVAQTDPNNGNASAAASGSWIRDTVAPAKITFTSPASNPYASGGSSITLSGPCEVGDTVAVSGAFSASALCSSGSYSFTSNKSSDGSYSYSVIQTDLAGNSSTAATFTWTRDTTTPSAPVISSPSSSPFYSNGSAVTVAGSCITGDTVNLSGASSQSMVCANSQFSFTVSKSTDGTYAYSVAQTDPNNGNASSAASGSWIRDTVIPAQITFTSPATNPYASGGNSITLSGPCVTGDTVTVSGAFSASALCSSGSYSFTSTKSSDGSYNYSVIQTDLAGNSSTASTFAWTRDTTTPSAPVISSPSSSPYYSNGNSVTVAGSCVTGDTVALSGAFSQSMVCANSQFSFTVSKSTDGTYAYSVAQTDPNNGNASSATSGSWIRDTVIPAQITFTSPASNPYASGGNSITLAGPCVTGDTVTVSGAFSASALCSSGSYSFTSTKSTDGSYSYSVIQTDLAGNSSTASIFAWTRDTTTPSAPVISSPSSSPFYSNGSSVTIAGSCVTGDTVALSGASSQSMVCASAQFSFTLSKSTDGTYAYSVAQTDPNNGNASAAASGSWIRDTVAPAKITFTSPASNPYASGGSSITLSGPCEVGDTVVVSGAFSASALCSSGSYSFTSAKSSDGSYSYSVIQTDLAGNSSTAATFAWTRDTTTPSTPVISSPSSSPYYSNGSSVTVAGSCVTGDTVNLSGASSQSMVCANSQFSFTVSKSIDGTYAYSVTQTDPNNGNASSAASGSWIRDTVVPAQITFASPATNPYASGGNSITFSGPCAIGDTVTVSGAFSASALCSSGSYSFTSTKSSDGAYSYTVVQTDLAGNSSPAAVLAWTRDTTTPGAPVISSPSSPYYSNGSSVTVAGSCVTGDTVNLSGASAQSMVCANSQFSFSISKSTDGTYAYSVTQTDPNNGDVSSAASGSWIRDTVAPAQITFTSPATNPYASGGNSITLSGPCVTGDTVTVSGAFSASALCSSGSYSFTSTKSSDGAYSYSVIQTDLAGNSSTAATFAWTRDTTTPSAPVITSPSSSPYYSNGSSVTVAGSCVTGDTVNLSGASSQSMVCANSQFAFTVSKSTDGTYAYSVAQTDPNNGNASSTVSGSWIRDTVPPALITFTSPATNPYASGGNSITLSGPCVIGDTVTVSGAFSASALCTSGSYSFTSTKSSDGAYIYTVVQTDLAGNSSAAATFAWTRDTTTPSAPVIASPSSSPYYSNGSSVTVAGSCVTGDTVNLSGASAQSMVCANSQFSFTVNKSTDGTYAFSVAQTDPNNGNASPAASGSWIRDTVAPAQITFTSPASNPYASGGNSITLSGPCVTGDTVTVSGAFSASALCSSGSYSFTSTKTSDGSYSYSVIQTDLAGNSSTAAAFAWTRDTTTPNAPVISSPSSSPYYSNGSSVTVAGSCITGDTVNLSGTSAQSMVCANSQFSFSISKSTDGTYAYSVAQTDPNNGNASSAASGSWIRDTVAPAKITFTSPASNPYASGGSSITLSGPCEVGDTVTVSGAFSASALCSSGSYSFTSIKSSDGSYSYSVIQTDLAGNSSTAATFAWTRDTTTPSAPVISSPSSSPFYSNGSSVTVSGSCVTGDTVNLSGASAQSMVCANSQFSFSISKSTDGTYAYSVAQTDPNNGNTSSTVSGSWIRITVAPVQITFTSPASNPYASGGNSITLSGPCVTGDTVTVSGAYSASALCTSGSYSFTSTKSSDGSYSYSVIQTDLAGNSSTAATFAWTRDTTTPSAPVISSPSSSPYYSNGSAVTVAGSCITGDTVNLSGASSQSMVCVNSQFSFSVSKSTDGTYAYSVAQTDPNNGNASSTASGSWIRDTVAPAQITFTSPATNPYASGGNSITLAGPCVTGDTVTVSGAFSASALCSSGSYSFTSTKSSDGSYSYSVIQTDLAGNSSTAATFAWTRDTTTPSAPVISSPSSSPFYSNGSAVTVSGSCIMGDTVNLSGASTQSVVCASSQFSFSISKSTDGTYAYSVAQTDPNNGNASSAASGSWIRDTVAPAKITFTSPASNPYASGGSSITLSGPCEVGDTVAVSGAFSANALCSSGSYSFTSTKSSDGAYTYTVVQTDLAGNSSTAATFTWTRDTTTPSAPVISSPSSSPFYSNGSAVTVSGSCITGDTVNLSGASTQSVVCASSQFSFSISKSTDGTYAYSVAQTDPNNGNASSAASGSWIRDTVAPAKITFTSPASNPYVSGGSSITLSGPCEVGDTVAVSGAFSASALCSSGSYSFTSTKSSDGAYTYTVVQTDLAGNSSTAATFTWTRDTTTPSAPVISSPSSSPFYSNGSAVTVSGSCITGDTVNLSGASTQSAVCASSQFSFSISKSTDGTYAYSVTQTNPNNGNVSSAGSGTWIRDTVPPAALTFTSPAANPYASGGTTLTISGSCEIGATVAISGAYSGSASCTGGSYSFAPIKTADGIYTFSLSQTDLAGNTSVATTLVWTRDTTTPISPTVTTPAVTLTYSNGSSLIISGACTSGDTVNITGDSTQTQTCSSSSYSFTVSKSVDGTYAFLVTQVDPNNGNSSSGVSLSWVRDTVAPAAVALSSPSSTPYTSAGSVLTIAGTCEANSTVSISGPGLTATTPCNSGAFSFTVSQTVDGSYSYSVAQVDRAGNLSPAITLVWTRDTTAPAAPVATFPTASPYYSNGSSLTLTGACITGDPVILSGSDSQSYTCASSVYTFTVNHSVDGTYNFSIVQQKPTNLLLSTSISQSWIRDTVAPNPIVITSPTSNPYTTAQLAITLTGTCAVNATVNLSGADSNFWTCSNGTFSFNLTPATDGTFTFGLSQTDLAGNTSTNVNFVYIRNSVAPSPPVVTVPVASTTYTNGSNFVISGTCITGDTINLTGASTQSLTCSSGVFSFSVAETLDGTYPFTVTQIAASNQVASTGVSIVLIRDTQPPAAPVFTSPVTNPYTSATSSFTLSGTCETNATVTLSGAGSGSTTCVLGVFSFSNQQSVDGTYSYSVTQTDLAGNVSSSTNFKWIRDTALPPTPTITSPSTNPYFSNGSSLTVTGSCVTGNVVTLSGLDFHTYTCASSTYTFTVSKTSDGTYNYNIFQTDQYTALVSAGILFTWVRDTTAPTAPVLRYPPYSPFYSSDSNVYFFGTCESGTTVKLSGSSSGSVACVRSKFRISATQTSVGTYNYTLTQTDAAGNISAGTPVQWIKKDSSTCYSTPYPTNLASSPYYSTGSSLVISGSCVTGNIVTLSGADSQRVSCYFSTYSFTVNRSVDGSYDYWISQTNTSSGVSSTQYLQTWVRDTSTPIVVNLVNADSSSALTGDTLELEGGCTSDQDVYVTGDDSQKLTCLNGRFHITVSKSNDSLYNFGIYQKSEVGTSGINWAQSWTKNHLIPSTPQILYPDASVTYSNASSFTIIGTCINGYPVTLSGSVLATDVTQPALSLVQICAQSQFKFIIAKTVDGTYNFSVQQSNGLLNSSTFARQWVRVTSAPILTLDSQPTAVYLGSSPSFAFHSNTTATIYCRVDSQSFAPCASPTTYSNLASSSHTFQAYAKDASGNMSATTSVTWTQQANNTIALYHFDSSPGAFMDSSLYTSSNNNPLTDQNTSSASSAKFGQGRQYTSDSGNSYDYSNNTSSQSLTNQTMSLETWLKFTSEPWNYSYAVLMSKWGSYGNYGWELKIARQGNHLYLVFTGSLDGVTTTDITSSAFSYDSSTFHHYAATWNYGVVNLFRDGVLVGSGNIGAGQVSLYNSTATLRIASGSVGALLNGILDEVRISQNIRWTSSFTLPTSPYSAD